MQIMEMYRLLNKLENEFVRKHLRRLIKYLERLDKLKAEQKITLKGYKTVKTQTQKAIREFIKEFSKEDKALLKFMYRKGWQIAYEDLQIGGNFSGIPRNALQHFDKYFLQQQQTIMKNYTADMMRLIENQLSVAIMNGESYTRIIKNLQEQIKTTAKRRVKVMVRDQLGRAMQMGIWNGYKENQDRIQYFLWIGPNDERTTEWCKNRKRLNPWEPEVVFRLEKENPITYKGLEIRDPKTGSFQHPHIQCRHRWVAVSKGSDLESQDLKGWYSPESERQQPR